MDYFESLMKTLLESEGYWVRQSFKVNLMKEEKRAVKKPSIPRPEIDLLAFNQNANQVLVLEAKSFLDSPGVRVEDLRKSFEIQTGQYKLFTNDNYRQVVFERLKQDLIALKMANDHTTFKLGLIAGNIYQKRSDELQRLFKSKNWFLWTPEIVKLKVSQLAEQSYENEPAIITAKILLR